LAEGEDLSSNPLRRYFNGLQTTHPMVYVAWRIIDHFGGLHSCHGDGAQPAGLSSIRIFEQGGNTVSLSTSVRSPASAGRSSSTM
jgi:hypothetical protein